MYMYSMRAKFNIYADCIDGAVIRISLYGELWKINILILILILIMN